MKLIVFRHFECAKFIVQKILLLKFVMERTDNCAVHSVSTATARVVKCKILVINKNVMSLRLRKNVAYYP